MSTERAEAIASVYGPEERRSTWRLAGMIACACTPGSSAHRVTNVTRDEKISFRRFAEIAQTSTPRVSRYFKAWERAAGEGLVPHAKDLAPKDWSADLMMKLAELEETYSLVLGTKVEKRAVTLPGSIPIEGQPPQEPEPDRTEYDTLVRVMQPGKARSVAEHYAGEHGMLPAPETITDDKAALLASAAADVLQQVRDGRRSAEPEGEPEPLIPLPGKGGLVEPRTAAMMLKLDQERAELAAQLAEAIQRLARKASGLLEYEPDAELSAFWLPAVRQAQGYTGLLKRALAELERHLEAKKPPPPTNLAEWKRRKRGNGE